MDVVRVETLAVHVLYINYSRLCVQQFICAIHSHTWRLERQPLLRLLGRLGVLPGFQYVFVREQFERSGTVCVVLLLSYYVRLRG